MFHLYRGDWRRVLPGLDVASINAVITDPPYGIGFTKRLPLSQRRRGLTTSGWDDDIPAAIHELLEIGTVQAIWGGQFLGLPPSRRWIGWMKPDAPPSMGNLEMAWTNQDRPNKCIVHSISATNRERVGHPTQKPLRVMRWVIEQLTTPGDIVFDPFMGSGTTGVACLLSGREFIGCEIDDTYFEMARRRIESAFVAGVD